MYLARFLASKQKMIALAFLDKKREEIPKKGAEQNTEKKKRSKFFQGGDAHLWVVGVLLTTPKRRAACFQAVRLSIAATQQH